MTESTLYFDQYELRAKPLALLRNGRAVELSSQPLRLLRLLALHAGQIVTHNQIREHLWRDQVVDFAGSIHVCVSHIRTALDDSGKRPRFIETIPRSLKMYPAQTTGPVPNSQLKRPSALGQQPTV